MNFILCVCFTDEYWAAHPELHDIPVYYASSLAKKCMAGMCVILLSDWCFLSCDCFGMTMC